ncbi:relaxase domain-containing protein [Streptomyces sp. P8-A8]|uniref:relaxase domain-containing protein n=1 Tax=Streptomyces sp. P8-A8 TaxID=3029759 RepID=UPI0036DC8731
MATVCPGLNTEERSPWLAMDLVFRAPSTAQISWALGDDEHRMVLELCQDIARDKALGWLEESVAQMRWGSGGKHREPVRDGLIVAVFRHYESRAVESRPLLHDHVVSTTEDPHLRGWGDVWPPLGNFYVSPLTCGDASEEAPDARVAPRVAGPRPHPCRAAGRRQHEAPGDDARGLRSGLADTDVTYASSLGCVYRHGAVTISPFGPLPNDRSHQEGQEVRQCPTTTRIVSPLSMTAVGNACGPMWSAVRDGRSPTRW